MKILIIDDEPLVRRSLRRVAESRGHEVFEADNGNSGLGLWTRVEPDLVYLDVLMPELSGPEVLNSISGQTQARVILISAYSGEYNVESAKSIGADLFIAKPFENIFEVISQGEELVGRG